MAGSVIVFGVNGQDGTFLARHLLARGENVVGVGRQDRPRVGAAGGFTYRACDLLDRRQISALLLEVQPSSVFHFAAVHASAAADNCYEPVFGDMLDVNVASLHVVLEHARLHDKELRVLYAGSAKCFGAPLPAEIDEATPRRNTCLYSITKNASASLVEYYRDRHAVRAGVLYLFNHESELRAPDYFIPKLVRAISRARAGHRGKTNFQTLDFSCDWGSADEYMDIAIDVLRDASGEDFVLGTGETIKARDLAERAFARYGLKVDDYVVERHAARVDSDYKVRIDKLVKRVGRRPLRTIDDVVHAMVRACEGDDRQRPK